MRQMNKPQAGTCRKRGCNTLMDAIKDEPVIVVIKVGETMVVLRAKQTR